ncbi:MAG: M24 family metallopeptidase [Thermaerobacter sp.]|nr:M24 family metallopeptidase [Thermaerobacter sp.]
MHTAFERAEYEARLSELQRRMSDRGLDALVVSDPANMYYLTGYDGWSFYVPQAVIVVLGEDQPVWIGRAQDRNGAKLTTWLDDAHLESYPEAYVQQPDVHPMDVMADLLRRHGRASKTIGVEMDAYYYSARAHAHLTRHLPDARFEDATLLVNWQRIVKSPQEIAYMRTAAAIASQAMGVAAQAIAVGARECDAAAAIFQSQIAGLADKAGDYPAIVPLMPSRERTSASHLTWVDRHYTVGDTVNIELAGCYRRYHAPLSRTMALGRPSKQVEALAVAVAEGVNEALGSARPGATCADVEAAWRKTIARHGFVKESRVGYAVGIGYPPDWGEHTASLREGDGTVLSPGMTFHLMAGMWLDAGGLEISETVLVTETGCEALSDFHRGLVVKDS